MPEVFIRRKMYAELGGYEGYQRTPLRELVEMRLSIIAEMNVAVEQEQEQQRELERVRREQAKGR